MKKNVTKDTGLKLLDVVGLLKEIRGKKLTKGQVGTIVEVFGEGAYEVEIH